MCVLSSFLFVIILYFSAELKDTYVIDVQRIVDNVFIDAFIELYVCKMIDKLL